MVRPQLGLGGYLEGINCVSKATYLGLEGKCAGSCEVLGSGSRVCKRFHPVGQPVLGGCRVDATGEITKDTTVSISCDAMDLNKRPVPHRPQQTSDDVYAKLKGVFDRTDHVLSGALTASDPNNISVTVQSLSRLIKDGTKVATEANGKLLFVYCTIELLLSKFVDKTVTQLVEATNRLEVINTNALKMTLSTPSAVTATSSDMAQSAQHQLSTFIQHVIKDFQKVSQTSLKVDSVAVGTIILSSFFDVLASATLHRHLVTLQEEVAKSLDSLLASDESTAASTELGRISLRKESKSKADSCLCEFYNDTSSSSITFTKLEDLFDDTDNILIQTMLTNGSLSGFADTEHNSVAAHSMAVGLTFYKNGEELLVREMPNSFVVRIPTGSSFLLEANK
ncbi:unnamed protein product [Taenia asiatica]|uniref:GPS domain-containing protein n=1 Tax=Taenia asiatica TaxID=60517 RepID=A0A0R3WES6_TAEAS|nr:unnamed protein product [Taenia asiatica]